MRLIRVIALAFLATMLSTLLLAQSTGPDDRRITDPQSIQSASNLRARPSPAISRSPYSSIRWPTPSGKVTTDEPEYFSSGSADPDASVSTRESAGAP